MTIILAIISLLLFVVVFTLDLVFSLFFEVRNRKWYELVSERMYRKAKLVDIFGNYMFPDFWSFLFSKRNKGYRFGRLGETISSCIGKKSSDGSLSIVGWVLYYILYAVDIPSWKYKGHCRRYIMTDLEIESLN